MCTLIKTGGTATKRICGSVSFMPAPVSWDVQKERRVSEIKCPTTFFSYNNWLLKRSEFGSLLSAVSTKAISVNSRRLSHTDVSFPTYDEKLLSKSSRDPTVPARETEDDRRVFSQSMLYGVGGSVALMAGVKIVQTLVIYKSMPADQLALANIEINLNEISEGQCKTFSWRGKPLFVAHRTQDDIEAAKKVNLRELRDPETDDQRVKKNDWLIVIGICSHLGCVPIAGKGEFGGYYCPCHGSAFDTSGRIRVGPAPTNLEVPPYQFTDDNTVVIGMT